MTTTLLSYLIELARETAGSEWSEVCEAAAPLAVEDLPGQILIGTGFFGEELLDGWHRVAGLARQYSPVDDEHDVEVPVTYLTAAETQKFKR